MTNQINISVRSLVEYVFRSGSIETGFRSNTSMMEGTKAHQKIQKTYGDGDLKEVYVQTKINIDGIDYVIDGRCDGLLLVEGELMVDEIKSTSHPLDSITENTYPVHWAQAIFYAYMVAVENDLNRMGIQLTYFQVDTEEKKIFTRSMSIEELTKYVFDVIQRFAPYAKWSLQHRERRDTSIKKLLFPFEKYREGQRKLAGAVYKTIQEEVNLFAKAPTGIGKTMSTLFPSVKAIGEGMLQRIFYLTAKTITRTTAEEAFSTMEKKGLHMNAVTITAKEKVCFQRDMNCNKDYCEFANGYYDRVNDAVLDILGNEKLITRTVIEQYAKKHTVCPFEFSLDVAYTADAIVCDYNYIFDPRVSLKRMFEEQKKQTVLLVDEAHNLVDRAREMYSATLLKSLFLHVKRLYKGIDESIYKLSSDINNFFIALKKENDSKEFIFKNQPNALVELLEAFCEKAERELAIGQDIERSQQLLEVYFSAQQFLRISKLYDEKFVTYIEVERNDVQLKLFCLDPSHLLQQMGKGFKSKVFFSATLSPMQYFRDMIGTTTEDYDITIPSPFHKEQLDISIMPISTRFRDREKGKGPIVELIVQTVENRPGNYLVFFPSYQYLKEVYEAFVEIDSSKNTIVQSIGMQEQEREDFLAAFDSENTQSLIGFAVMGGIFSEGIDLQGDRLNGVIVVGVGLPQFCFERDIIKDYFNGVEKNGFYYSYVFPGMNKVLQAGGRLIRSEEDSGTIVLVDDRFLQQPYRSLLPDEWRHFKVLKP